MVNGDTLDPVHFSESPVSATMRGLCNIHFLYVLLTCQVLYLNLEFTQCGKCKIILTLSCNSRDFISYHLFQILHPPFRDLQHPRGVLHLQEEGRLQRSGGPGAELGGGHRHHRVCHRDTGAAENVTRVTCCHVPYHTLRPVQYLHVNTSVIQMNM